MLRARPARDRQVEPAAPRRADVACFGHVGRQRRSAAHRGAAQRCAGRLAASHCRARRRGAQARSRRRRVVGRARCRPRENRLVEFFWEIVLTNTAAPIVVLVDDVDAALALPFAADLLDAVGGCYARRSRETDFARLGFALAGCTSQRELERASAAFARSRSRAHRARRLHRRAVVSARRCFRRRPRARSGLDGPHLRLDRRPSLSDATRGARRRAQRRPVRGCGARRARAAARARSGEQGPAARSRARLVRRAVASRRGARRSCCKSSLPAARSRNRRMPRSRSGCGFRAPCASTSNASCGSATASSKSSSRPVGSSRRAARWRWLAAAAVLLAAVAAGGYWYTQRLPVADIETLTSSAAAPDAVEDAYRRLRGLPGFAQRADELWLAALGRQSRAATTLAARAARTRGCASCRARRSRGPLAQRVLVAPRARAGPRRAARRGDFARAARRGSAGRGSCRRRLSRRARRRRLLEARAVAAPRRLARVLAHAVRASDARLHRRGAASAAHAVRRRRRSGALGAAPLGSRRSSTAALTRELAVEGEGTAGELELSLAVQHAAAGELLVTLTAPSGAEAALDRPAQRRRARRDVLVPSRARLAARAARRRRRARRLALDHRRPRGRQHRRVRRLGPPLRRQRSAATIRRSSSRFRIPQRVEAVNVQAVADRAVVWPVSPGAIGTVALWNLGTGQLEHDFTLPAAPRKSRSMPRARACSRRPIARCCCGMPATALSSRASRRRRSSFCRRCFPPTAATSRSPSASTARIRCTACCAAPTRRWYRRSRARPTRKVGSSARAGATSRCKARTR